MNDDFEFESIEMVIPEDKPKPKSRKTKVELRDDMYLALHGLYNKNMSIKRGSIFFMQDAGKTDKLIEVGAIRKVQDIDMKKLKSISKYRHLLKDDRYKSVGDLLQSLNEEIASNLRIPHNIVVTIRELIEAELSQIEE